MKKLFPFRRLVVMFALGAMATFVGCNAYDDDINNLNERIDALEGTEVKGLQDQVAALTSSLSNIDDFTQTEAQKLADLTAEVENEIADLEAELATKATPAEINSAIATATSDIQAEIDALGEDMSEELAAAVAELEDAIAELEANSVNKLELEEKLEAVKEANLIAIYDLQGEISGLKVDLENLNTELSAAIAAGDAASIEAINAAKEDLKMRIDSAFETIAALQIEVDELTDDVEDIALQILENCGDIVTLEGEVLLMGADIEANADAIEAIQEEVAEIAILKEDIAALQAAVALNIESILALEDRCDSLYELIKTNEYWININIENIDDNAQAILVLDELTSLISEQVTNLASRISELETSVEIIESTLTEMNTTLTGVVADCEEYGKRLAGLKDEVLGYCGEFMKTYWATLVELDQNSEEWHDFYTAIEDALLYGYYNGGILEEMSLALEAAKTEALKAIAEAVAAAEQTLRGEIEALANTITDDLKSLQFVPDAIDNGLGTVSVASIYGYEPALRGLNDNANPIFVGTNGLTLDYRTTTAIDVDAYDWWFIDRYVNVTRAGDDMTKNITIEKIVLGPDNDEVKVDVRFNNLDPYHNWIWASYRLYGNTLDWTGWGERICKENGAEESLIALSATPIDAPVAEAIVSDYQTVHAEEYRDFAIYNTSVPKAIYPETKNVAYAVPTDERVVLKFEEGAALDISKIVSTWTQDGVKQVAPNAALDFEPVYTYENIVVIGHDYTTPQNEYVKLDEETGILYLTDGEGKFTSSSLGKEPIIYVTASVNGVRIAECYVPIVVKEVHAPQYEREDFEYEVLPFSHIYRELADGHEFITSPANLGTYNGIISWDDMSRQIYDAITADTCYLEPGLQFSQNLFNECYDIADITATGTFATVTSDCKPRNDGSTIAEAYINATKLGVTPSAGDDIRVIACVTPVAESVIGTQNSVIYYSVTDAAYLGTYYINVIYTINDPDNKYRMPEYITVRFSVTITETDPTLTYNESIMYNIDTDLRWAEGDCWGKYVANNNYDGNITAVNTYKMQQSIEELFVDHLANYETSIEPNNFKELDFDVVTSTQNKYRVYDEYPAEGVNPGSVHLSREVGLIQGLRMSNEEENVTLTAKYQLDNNEWIDGQNFVVNFQNPFAFSVADVVLNHLPIGPEGEYNTDRELVDMKVMARKEGLDVPEGAVILENNSRSTTDNAEFVFTDAEYKGEKVYHYTADDFVVNYGSVNDVTVLQGEFADKLGFAYPNYMKTWTNWNPGVNTNMNVVEWTYQGGDYVQDLKATSSINLLIGEEFSFGVDYNIIVEKQ